MTWDTAVIGGGPAGSAAAARLAAAGRRVVVIERRPEPHQSVCGEFLGSDAAEGLGRLGLDAERLGALPISRLRLTAGRRETTIPLPFAAWSLGRDVLDHALLETARANGAVVRRGVATGLVTIGEEVITADTVVLATGKHDLRGHRRTTGGRLGFKQYWRLARRLDQTVELHLFPGGYAGLQPAAGGLTNLCLTLTPEAFRRCCDWAGVVRHLGQAAPLLGERLAGGCPAWPRPLATAALPYGYLAPDGQVHRVGDQLAVIHSLCGEGIAMALGSGMDAAERIIAGQLPQSSRRYSTAVGLGQAAAGMMTGAPRMALETTRAAPGLLTWLARKTRHT